MATLTGIVKARRGTAGSNGAWRVERTDSIRYTDHVGSDDCPVFTLWHYSTEMLVWADCGEAVALIDYSTGHGSVSDQNGMNKAFRALGLNLYYSRQGGAEVR